MLRSHILIFVNLFASCQITEVQFASEEHAPVVSRVALHQHLENSMRSTGVNVVSSLPGDSV